MVGEAVIGKERQVIEKNSTINIRRNQDTPMRECAKHSLNLKVDLYGSSRSRRPESSQSPENRCGDDLPPIR